MIVRYTGHFTVKGFIHEVQFYKTYSKERGLEEEVVGEDVRSSSMVIVIKKIKYKLTKAQVSELLTAMSERSSIVIDEHGKLLP
jgi:hypothetical protein